LTFFFLCQATSALVGRPPTGGGSIYFLSHSLFLFFQFFYFFLMFILLYASSLENKRERENIISYNTTTQNITK
jgi:Ca2+/Na+ antiporter